MLSIFVKKRFLADILKGLVDIHNHILPSIDDGAKTPQESLDLIKGLSDLGIERFIATPHIMNHYYPNNRDTINTARKELKTFLKKEKRPSEIAMAAEHMIDDNFEQLLETDAVLPLGKDHLLVEMSYLQPPINFDQAIHKVQQKGFFPVLAHPERYNFLHNQYGRYTQMKQAGIKFQLNLLSLGGYYGKGIQKTAFKLIEDGFIDFVGTDTHHMGHVEGLKQSKILNNHTDKLQLIIHNTIQEFY